MKALALSLALFLPACMPPGPPPSGMTEQDLDAKLAAVQADMAAAAAASAAGNVQASLVLTNQAIQKLLEAKDASGFDWSQFWAYTGNSILGGLLGWGATRVHRGKPTRKTS